MAITSIDTFNTSVTETASEILGKNRTVKEPWVTANLLDLCDKRRELKKKMKEPEGAQQYTLFILRNLPQGIALKVP